MVRPKNAYSHHDKSWRARADACRAIAATSADPSMREKMLRLAADCDRKAEEAEEVDDRGGPDGAALEAPVPEG